MKILRKLRMNSILEIINKLPINNILDVGCSDDCLLKMIGNKFNYLGIDEEPYMYDKELNLPFENSKISKCKLEDLPKNKKYDLVMATEVLEHVDDPVSMINLMKKISNRFILISVPNEPFFSLMRFFIPAPEHLWTIFPWALEKHLGKPILKKRICFKRSYVGLWDLSKSENDYKL